MKIDLASEKTFYISSALVLILMTSLFFWRLSEAERQIEKNIVEQVSGLSHRVANSVIPLVYNIYKKATERHFTKSTASAILDSELNADFIHGIKVFGNFGHLFMGAFKNENGELIHSDEKIPEELGQYMSMRTPVKQEHMTIGNIQVYYSYGNKKKQLNKVIIQEILQISAFTVLIWVLFFLIKKASIERNNTLRAFEELGSTQKQLINSEKLLKEANLNLEDKVNQRTRELQQTNEQLSVAREEADSASKAKSLFLANMSHEIRTPMNGVIGLTELLMRTELTTEQISYLEKLQYTSNNLLHILNEILDLSKIEAGKLNIEHRPFDFMQMFESVLAVAKPKAHEKRLELIVEVSTDFPPLVVGDSVRCSQIFANLLSNAIKFTKSGHIKVELKRETESDYIGAKITDTGIGIKKSKQDKLFSTFTQADDSTSRKYGGTGLGLAICQHLVQLMDGQIELSSRLGQGSCFEFSLFLPVSKEQKQKPEAKHNENESYLSDKLLNRCVLLVEDNEINRLVATKILEQAGLVVDTANNGLEAVEKAKFNTYELIVIDIQMPEMDGYEATRIIRTLPEYAETPIIAMTANAMTDDIKACMDAGMNSHLSKPIQVKQVISEIERHF